jgi:hypothetical protein
MGRYSVVISQLSWPALLTCHQLLERGQEGRMGRYSVVMSQLDPNLA